jgi:4-hydroxy-tetrahydrodipicolinate reductase
MNIALIGYGKMGKAIEKIVLEKGHTIALKIDVDNPTDLNISSVAHVDVAIEFTGPHSAIHNLLKCFELGLPVVCGSTGWLAAWDQVKTACEKANGTLVYASNYSIGVNLFFEINKQLARLMNNYPEYDVSMREIHHTEKKDAPSGTAITLAEQVIEAINRKERWTLDKATDRKIIPILAERIDPAPGTHHILYESAVDNIEIIHTAHNRTGFAGGAIKAAEFAIGKKGIFGMKEVLGF